MKKSLQLFALATLMLGAASCDKFDIVVDPNPAVPFDSVFVHVFDDSNPNGEKNFVKTQTISLRHQALQDQANNIDAFTINGITAQVLEYTNPGLDSATHTISDLKLFYDPEGAAPEKKIGTIRNLDLVSLSASKEAVPVQFDDKAAVEQDFKNMIKGTEVDNVLLILKGTNASGKPIKAKIQFNMDANMTVKLIRKS